jgi:hypothetical protein
MVVSAIDWVGATLAGGRYRRSIEDRRLNGDGVRAFPLSPMGLAVWPQTVVGPHGATRASATIAHLELLGCSGRRRVRL